MVNALHRFFCGVFRGHDAVLSYGSGRIAVTCHSCGWESVGWTTGPPIDAQPKVVRMVPLNLRVVRGERRRIA